MAVYRVIFNLQNYLKITTSIVFVTMELLQGYISFVLGLSFCLLALGDEMVQTKYVAVGESERHSYMEFQST